MMRSILITTLCLLLAFNAQVSSITLECYFLEGKWGYSTESVYYCSTKNVTPFNGTRQRIDDAIGSHTAGKTNALVFGFSLASAPNLNLFPTNLENVFGALTHIQIVNSNLKEITQDDLRVFPELKYLWLGNNNLNAIEPNTFAFNPNLEAVGLNNNQLTYLDPAVFGNLNGLRAVKLVGNPAGTLVDATSRAAVESLVDKLETLTTTTATTESTSATTEELTTTTEELTTTEEPTTTEELTTTSKAPSLKEEIKNEIDDILKKLEGLDFINDAFISRAHTFVTRIVTALVINTDLQNQFESLENNAGNLDTALENIYSFASNHQQQLLDRIVSLELNANTSIPIVTIAGCPPN